MTVYNLRQEGLDPWLRKVERRIEACWKESTKRVLSKAQGRIPVDTGYARASVQVSTDAMPPIDPRSRGGDQTYQDTTPVAVLAIAGASPGQTIYIGWTAAYAGVLENGHSQQAPSGFVRISAEEWPHIFNEVVQELRARITGG
jgi:hypothetical protein